MEELYIDGQVQTVIFSNAANFFKVILIKIEETNLDYDEVEIVVVGNFGQIQEGESYTFYGVLTEHPRFGVQLKASRYASKQPSSETALINYLSSSKFKGIGQVTAEKIVDTLGLNCLDDILENPDILTTVPGLNKKKRQTLVDVIETERGMQKVILTLNQYGISNQLAYRIYSHYDDETLEVVQTNPYQLAIDIQGIGFNKADYIAEELDIPEDSSNRIQAGIYFVLLDLSLSGGHTYIEARELLYKTIELLEASRSFIIDPKLVEDNIHDMVDQQAIIVDQNRFYIPSLFAAEWGIVSSIDRLMSQQLPKVTEKEVINHLEKVQSDFGIEYGRSQQTAIKSALTAPLFILTGGPGTGKTTVLRGIVQIFSELNDLSLDPTDYKDEAFPILMAAPTGRAAKQMTEATGLPASTIHRLLGLSVDNEERQESYESTMLSGKLLIIDEMSMVDTWLANQLFKAIPSTMQVILVGDKDQLPSVGPGQVLRDLLESKKISQMELSNIYRQGDGSSIIQLAHHIKQDQLPADFSLRKIDRSFIPCQAHNVSQVVTQVVSRAVDKGYTVEDIQVLAPMYRGEAGIDKLNNLLQNLFNPNDHQEKKEVHYMDKLYRIGDKVLHLVNEAERGVFNGDIGYITGIIPKHESELNTEELVIDFDGNEISYPRNEWNKITLAYCCSIHKAQGSEYKMVILPMVNAFYRMLKKDLLYTAITRASQFLIMCGELEAYQRCVHSTELLRQTTLREFLLSDKDSLDHSEGELLVNQSESELNPTETEKDQLGKTYILTNRLIISKQIDPMIGMNGLTPQNCP